MAWRREVVGGAGALIVASVTGCLGFLTGSDPAEFAASPTRVADDALDATGYALVEVEDIRLDREFEAGGQTREVIVQNWQTKFDKALDAGPLGRQEGAVFTAVSTPQVRVLTREFNPIADLSAAELAEMVQNQYEDVGAITPESEDDVTIHGESTTQTKFRAEGVLGGDAVELFLHISEAIEMGDDLVVTVGAYPEFVPDEEDHILQMMEAVEPDE